MGDITVRAALVVCSCDLPARALIMNMLQYNGKHGCHLCEDSGDTAPGKPLHRYWPWKPSSTPRTHQSLIINAKDATIDGVTVSAEVIYSLSSSEQANTGTCLNYITYTCRSKG